MDGWMDGRMDGWMDKHLVSSPHSPDASRPYRPALCAP